MRGSDLTDPHWIACADKLQAVLVDLESVTGADGRLPAAARSSLDAIATIGLTIAYTSSRSGTPLAGAIATLTKAGLPVPKAGETLFAAAPGHEAGARATAGARYCVIALAGDRTEDFPNRAPEAYDKQSWPAAWFLLATR